ncbi:class E sortase [Aquihabitans sp. McL0605]|uniref:class E sortase n=1 Tax=Aquihabitans sp. McL0605 TaxID=3415671 RepID=UPI003CE69AE4
MTDVTDVTVSTSGIDPALVRLAPEDGAEGATIAEAEAEATPAVDAEAGDSEAAEPRPKRFATAEPGTRPPLTPGRIALLAAGWSLLLVFATLVVVYPLGPTLQHRAQHRALQQFRRSTYQAANATQGLAGRLETAEPTAPSIGDPVGILDIGGSSPVRQVVREGATSSQTWQGPGHVPGTAGLGQPGNAVVVARRTGWGGPFAHLDGLRKGQPVVVTTLQGQTVYRVKSVRHQAMRPALAAPSSDDRLTLITSASAAPWSATRAVVVVAEVEDRPFEPTPQQGRTAGSIGTSGDHSVLPQLAFFLVLFGWVAWQTSNAHRRWRPVTAYLVTTPALVVLAILVAESLSRLLPAWS